MTSMQRIDPILSGITPRSGEKTEAAESGSLFGDIFQSAIGAVRETDAEKTQAQYLMATGQLDNPASLTIASTKAQISVQLLVQLRNKALESYNELMRINL